MKWTTGGMIALSALVGIGATDISAQDEIEVTRGPAFRRGPGIEAIMQMRERLELSEDQINSLDQIRREAVERRNAHMAEMVEIRSQLAAGQIQRSDMLAFMEDRQAAAEGVREAEQERVNALLTEAQLESLQELRTRGRAFARGRTAMQRGNRSMRGGRGVGMRSNRGLRGGRGGGMRGGRRGGMGPQRGFRGARGPGRGGFGAGVGLGGDIGPAD